MAKRTKSKAATQEVSVPTVPQWAVQPYLYQQLILQWFETIHQGLKEIHAVLEKIETQDN
jgi:hypothetical protein